MKLNKIYQSLIVERTLIESNLKRLKVLLEQEIKVSDELNQKLRSINNDLTRKMVDFLNGNNIKDGIAVDYVDYDKDNGNLLTLGYTDGKGNQRNKLMKVMKLMKYLGASIEDIKGYDIEELISHLQKGDTDNLKVLDGDDILYAYHCKNYDDDETMGSCMRYESAQAYLKIYTDNPNQVKCLTLVNPKNNKVKGRALLWKLDNGEVFMDRVYLTNNEYRKYFNTYAENNNISTSSPSDTVTLDNGGKYEYYPFMDSLMYYTPDSGVLSANDGELELQDTGGGDSSGVYSEVHDARIPEDEAVYVNHIEDWVYDHEVEESWERDGTYLYKDANDVHEIDKGDYRGYYALSKDIVEDYNNEIIVAEECYMIDAGENEGYWALDTEVILDYFDRAIMRYEAITATMGSTKGETILDDDAFIFTSGPNRGKIFHEQDEDKVEDGSKYEYVKRVLSRDEYVLNEGFLFNKLCKEMLNEYVSPHNLKNIENYLDDLFRSLHIDVEFSSHFLDRANDPRNGKEIEGNEIINTFNRLYKKHGKGLTNFNKETEAVITDLNNNINIPFVLTYDKKTNEFQLINKTIMRKRNFSSSNRKFKV